MQVITSSSGPGLPVRKIFGNPYYIFSLVMLTAFLLFVLGWSDLFPRLEPKAFVFSVGMILAFAFFGILDGNRLARIDENRLPGLSFSNLVWASSGVLLVYILEMAYNGKIPLLDLLMFSRVNRFNSFKAFPFFHYSAFAAGLMLIAVLFRRYLDSREKRNLLLIGLNLVPFLLYYKRAAFVLVGVQCLFYYVLKRRRFAVHQVAAAGLVLVLTAYLFGVAGDFRERGKSETFEEMSRINELYPDFLPQAMVWTYMYAASPMANLIKNLTEAVPERLDFAGLVAYEFLPAKARMARLWQRLGLQEREPLRIAKSFNVSTIFAGPFAYAGWWGIGLMTALILAVLTIVIRLISRPSPYSQILLSVLCTFSVFSFFSNMLSFTPMFLWLFGGLAMHLVFLWTDKRNKKAASNG